MTHHVLESCLSVVTSPPDLSTTTESLPSPPVSDAGPAASRFPAEAARRVGDPVGPQNMTSVDA